MQTLTSTSNSLVKQASRLAQKKYRQEQNAFLLEGFKVIKEALDSNFACKQIFCVKDKLAVSELAYLQSKDIELINVTDDIIQKISDTVTAQPVVAVMQLFKTDFSDIKLQKDSFIIVLDDVKDPGNLGTIIRTADACAASAVVLTKECTDIFSPKVIRATMGSVFHLPIITAGSKDEIADYLRQTGFKIFTTAADGEKNLYKTEFSGRLAAVMGSEASGVSDFFCKKADFSISIPILGKAESLNVAVALALVAYRVKI